MSLDDTLLNRLYRHVAHTDLMERDPAVREAIAGQMIALSKERPAGRTSVRVFNPSRAEDGWTSRHTVIQVVTEDRPFLVDSVLGELSLRGLGVHLLVHPQVVARKVDHGTEPSDVDVAEAGPDDVVESWIHVEIDRLTRESSREDLEERLRKVLADVRRAWEDWPAMRERARDIIAELTAGVPDTVDPATVQPTIDFLTWLEDNHFTFLGYREYELVVEDGVEALRSRPETGLGILRARRGEAPSVSRLRPEAVATAREPRLLTITKANSRATVHRPVYLDYIGVREFSEAGDVVAERRFLGLFTQSAYADSVKRLPVIGAKVRTIIERSGFASDSHSGKDLMGVLENYPRDELFQADTDWLVDSANEVLHLQERRGSRLLVRKDEFGRFVSLLVLMPRDRFNTAVRQRIETLVRQAYGAETVDYSTKVGESPLAQVHYVLRMPPGSDIPEVDAVALQARVQEAMRTWHEQLADVIVEHEEDETVGDTAASFSAAFPEGYKEDFDPATGYADLARIRSVVADPKRTMALHLYAEEGAPADQRRLKLYRQDAMTLTEAMPIFSHLGVQVTDERPYVVEEEDDEIAMRIYDFGLEAKDAQVWEGDDNRTAEQVAADFEEAFSVAWSRQGESDNLNSLVLDANLNWRSVVILRTLVRYLRQVGSFSLEYLEEALTTNPHIARLLVRLFTVRFDPSTGADDAARDESAAAVIDQIQDALQEVASLDQDRIIKSLISVVEGTLRTNFYQLDEDGRPKPHVSLKLSPRDIEGLPEPRPAYEIWVYAPRVEGVHLRFGAVARGGLRWSDRREDFRTEVLGLVKAQMVKNAVIVPTGSKGGFVAKQLPDPSDRDAFLNEGVGCYKIFIKGLLDVTDNRVDGQIVPPENVVRRDGDDSYLVVAADKGTARFSDIANGVSRDYGFWLDDAFASGGSAGYDHKGMGITARGAWESVKRHFRELGHDTQTQDFTAVGIGDMSGDVFGNGMLLSEHIRLVGAFDHRHVFLDPDPDAARSHAERRRLFDLPGSSWADYDTALISEGGGVYPRSAKSVSITPQVREVLGLEDDVTEMSPNQLLSAVLKAPVDLLWNGGIGTYVKSEAESDAQIGDRANDAIRINGGDLRVRVVGEGGNLGFSQRGRIEAANAGIHINTDAIDNSAGVDTSDHEVNIKIALAPVVASGDMALEERDELLESMTGEVAQRVLRTNYEQNVLIGNARDHGGVMTPVHRRLMDHLAEHAGLDRELEFLPDDRAMEKLEEAGKGLTSPEFSVLVAYSKLDLKESLSESDLPDFPFFADTLRAYFPQPLNERLGERIGDHPLRREIIVNDLANSMVNRGGITFAFRCIEETAANIPQIARAFVVCRSVFDMAGFMEQVEALDNKVDTALQTKLYLEFRRLMDRSVRWFLNNQSLTGHLESEINRFTGPVNSIRPKIGDFLLGAEVERFQSQAAQARDGGVPEELALTYAGLLDSFSVLDIVELAEEEDRSVEETAALYYAVSERFRIDTLLNRVAELARQDRWDSLARGAMRDDLYGVLKALTRTVLSSTESTSGVGRAQLEGWAEANAEALTRVSQVLSSVDRLSSPGMGPLSVALRALRGLVRQGASN
ncbi:NAD-glutamate dehydrogenase [Ornithinimicrobium cryptoxanthini]|uniref:NAD-glutamate dehydrogenase n=1 Tax=Ornithinimicrobium cryptoxanthini TaxID=2934161 RepID=A0ABY4YEQ9_9MICO|nr:NAD-glutamate dehydrogenase [Ornithinimicrobium cryptoxanthini]USQ75268.1 NAD-glutamate dehydrogenase [Ornithinimicrobium cryptoxanthini]